MTLPEHLNPAEAEAARRARYAWKERTFALHYGMGPLRLDHLAPVPPVEYLGRDDGIRTRQTTEPKCSPIQYGDDPFLDYIDDALGELIADQQIDAYLNPRKAAR